MAAGIAPAFERLQAGDATGALGLALVVARSEPANPRAHLAAGIALRLLGRLPEAQLALERAAQLDPGDYAAAYEIAVAHQLGGDPQRALAQFKRAAALRPGFFAAQFSAGLLQFERRDWPAAIASFRNALAIDAGNVDTHLNLGQALIEAGQPLEGERVLGEALALEPARAEALHAMGWAQHRAGRPAEALANFQAAAAAEPRNPDWHLAVAKAMGDMGRHEEAESAYVRALAAGPDHFLTLRTFGRHSVARGNFARAAALFAEALRQQPGDSELPMFLAQVELLQGRWREGWAAYARRDARVRHEQSLASTGHAYQIAKIAELAGGTVTLAGEQGLGDTLFFLRFAPALKAAGATLRFAGDPRLHSLLARTGLFESFLQDASEATPDAHCILVADLPSIAPDPFAPSLHIAPQPGRVSRWRAALQAAGPRPWIGVTWRAGTPPVEVAHALYKSIPLASLCAAVAPLGGTVFALQRYPEPGEIDAAGRALGAAVHDFSRASDDLEDVLALLSLLDRHIGVSNTNMHLVAATGATADVLVPFPPEWRWRTAGTSPWFPGFRIHRQDRERDWTAALRGLAP